MRVIDRVNPLLSRARPRLGLRNEYREAAVRSWVLAPAVETWAPPAIYDPADLEKVTGVADDDTMESQVKRAQGGLGSHKATVAYEIRRAVLSNGNLFSRNSLLSISGKKLSLVAPKQPTEYQDAVLASSQYGVRYFGHWMSDDLPTTLAAYDLGHPVSVLTDPTPSQRGFLNLLDLKPDEVSDAYFERIVVIDDVGQNNYKQQRYHRLHQLAETVATTQSSNGVMVLRGASGARRLLTNEAEVADCCRRRGMKVIDPSQMTAEEIVNASFGADIVLGVEGSQLSNSVMWMSATGTVVTIQPPQRFVMVIKDRCDCMGVRFAFIVADPVSESDFHVDIAALERLLDRVSKPKSIENHASSSFSTLDAADSQV
jgi:hypothetical protein